MWIGTRKIQTDPLPGDVILCAPAVNCAMARSLNPLGCRVGRAERAAIVTFARERGMSISGLMKLAIRGYLASQPAVVAAPPVGSSASVHAGVHRLSDLLSSPPMVRPFKLARGPVRRGSAVGGERKVWLSDF